jgi:hypothetical protein
MTVNRSAETANKKRLEAADKLYEQYGKPLEKDHAGEFVAIALDGRTVVAGTLLEVSTKAIEELGPGSFVFKIGLGATGKLR